MDIIQRLVEAGKQPPGSAFLWRAYIGLFADAAEAIEQLRAQVQMLGKEPVA